MTTQPAKVCPHFHTLLTHSDPAVVTAAQHLHQTMTRRRRILDLVQEALSTLRLDMKYLMFDLEATRRERDNARDEK